MSFKRIGTYKRQDRERVFSQNDFSGGISPNAKFQDSTKNLKYMENMMFDSGSLVCRKGQKRAMAEELGKCKGSIVYGNNIIMHIGESLYSWHLFSTEPPQPICELPAIRSNMFTFANKLYILSNAGYFCYDGSTIKEVEPYIPVIAIDRSKDGSTSSIYESLNLIGNGFTVWFNFDGDGTYELPLDNLKDDFLATLNGIDISSSCEFDALTGRLSVNGFSQEDEGINNLRITAYRKDEDIAEGKNMILGCSLSEIFGGTDGFGTRVFLSGNLSFPTYCFRSGLLDPTYFPDTDYEIIGDAGDTVTALKKQYNELIVFCKNSIHAVSYIIDNGEVIFSRRTIHPSIGCSVQKSIQLIDNNLVFFSSDKGVMMISSTISQNENNVVQLSQNINKGEYGLLPYSLGAEDDMFSIDHMGKYHLFVKNKVFVWDYNEYPYLNSGGTIVSQKKLCWYIYTNMKVNHPFEYYNYIFYFSDEGCIDYYAATLSDFGFPVNARIVTADSGLGLPRLEKKLHHINISYSCDEDAKIELFIFRNGAEENDYESRILIKSESTKSPTKKHYERFPVSIAPAHSFNVEIKVNANVFELHGIDFEYSV